MRQTSQDGACECYRSQALKQYKELLGDSHAFLINSKFEELKALIVQDKSVIPAPEHSLVQPANDQVEKRAVPRSEILNFALCHVAIAHYEKEQGTYFEHQVQYLQGDTALLLDALRQDDGLPEDIILDFHYLRKPYMDTPVYGPWLAKKLEIYHLLTGRPARGVLIVVVGRERMLTGDYLSMTKGGVASCAEKVELKIYSCEQVGFYPGPVCAGTFASNIKIKN